ncbi:GNAT family N-acetyltransferase [Flavobacterium sp.]|uniref:GNAT family N-acetyltransferase n=1 Tax=Flavobacterium sp. TaxID=239 RepID=UPI00286E7986|nr:GNAT family N-acetyltransferase [Flavobacterium sp.]
MNFNLQPTLQNEIVKIRPLQLADFESLYAVASDPEIWEQHPNKERYKKDVFEIFFKGAIESKGAFIIYDATSNKIIGSTRFYDFNAENSEVLIGYTFLAKAYWGSVFNQATKKLLMEYAFQYVDAILFHIGANNIRSQKAIAKLGAIKIDEILVAYYGEPEKLNFIYQIKKESWVNL